MPFSQIIPPSPSPTESKRLFYTSVSLLLSHIQGYRSVQFNRSVVSDSLRPLELQHARPPCPSPTPKVHPNSRPSSQGCHPAISSSVIPFSSCPQSLPAWVFSNESTLRMRWPKYWSFIFLNSIYMCYTVLVFFFLAYFTLYNRLQFDPPHKNWFKCNIFNGWVILHCVYVPQLSYPFICWWTSRLLPCSDYYNFTSKEKYIFYMLLL